MELRHLRHFVALAEEEHFGRAAERVFVVQQALSNSIRNLEEELGVPLVLRTTRQVQLTPAGKEFLKGARQILSLANQTIDRTRRASQGEVGRLTIGFASGLVFGGLPEIVRAFREFSPQVSVDLHELTAGEQETALRSGHIDVGLMLLPVRDPNLKSLALWQEHVMAALPSQHPLTKRSQLNISDLSGESFVFFPRHLRATYFDQVMRWCSAAGFTPQVAQEAIEIPTLLSLVAAGVGVFLPLEFFQRLSLPGVTYLPIKDAPIIEIVAVWDAKNTNTPVIEAFLSIAQQVLGQTIKTKS